jgi:dCTP deaminase
MQLSDVDIIKLVKETEMISPFFDEQVRVKSGTPRISYGLTSGGYDFRLDPTYGLKVFKLANKTNKAVDPKNFDPLVLDTLQRFTNLNTEECWWELPGYAYALGLSTETFSIPRNVIGQVQGKSTYARSGVIINVTPAEPGWKGRLVVEFLNGQSSPVRIYGDEGIGQIGFHELSQPVAVSYADRDGKYQNQNSIVYSIV